jgi:protein O-mannosyl-transferase
MLVTVPFVLLLIDYWPLHRITGSSSTRMPVLEKIPLLILSAASCLVTLFAQKNAISTLKEFPLAWRINNAAVSCMTYIWQMIWPMRLIPFYPHPEAQSSLGLVALSVAVIASISGLAIFSRRKWPYFFTGWFWYLGMLMPVIGIVQVGMQAHADRYTYLPQIGLYMAVTWGASDLVDQLHFKRYILATAGAGVIALLTSIASVQVSYWQDSERLWKHTLAIQKDNVVGHYRLGDFLIRHGQIEKAISEFRVALSLRPDSPYVEDYLGVALLRGGRTDEAIQHLKAALRLMPDHPTARFNLGNALFQQGDLNGAISQYRDALAQKPNQIITGLVEPNYAAAHYDLGNCYVQSGNLELAIKEYEAALRFLPQNPQMHNNLGFALSQAGKTREAIAQWEEALRLQSTNIEVMGNLAWVLSTSPDQSIRNGQHALDLAQHAEHLSEGNPKVLRVLAAAYAETGKFPEAVDTAQRGLEVADKQGDASLAETLQSELALYRSHTPLHE